MSSDDKRDLRPSSRNDVDRFLRQVAATPSTKRAASGGRLVFAMDATASREPTWDTACQIQSEMFSETAGLGGLSLQLCYYRGFREFHASEWVNSSASLVPLMTSVFCLGGHTQIERVLRHGLAEQKRRKLDALVFVGDCMEEDADTLCALAGELGLLGVPVFLFHEGLDSGAGKVFQQIARLSGGAYCRFDSNSAEQLKALLSAVAVFAAGGRNALEDFGKSRGGVIRQLTHQMGNKP